MFDRYDAGTRGFLKQLRFLGVLPGASLRRIRPRERSRACNRIHRPAGVSAFITSLYTATPLIGTCQA